MKEVAETSRVLKKRFETLANKRDILKASEFKDLYARMSQLTPAERPAYGQAVNALRQELEAMVDGYEAAQESAALPQIDPTAPFDTNIAPTARPQLLGPQNGSKHPLSAERQVVADIFSRMGFRCIDSRQIDDDYHMFGSLNFPPGHPARDDYDTFVTEEGLIAPAHTSTMQNRALKHGPPPIRTVAIGRVFRNEDLDAKHEHTLNQVEGIYVDKQIHTGHLIAVLREFLETYYQTHLKFRIQPAYFPFVEPGLEFAMSCPFCHEQGCATCKYEGWIELIGCGMIHPNVLLEGGIDPKEYTGFAWGFGLDRLVMMKYDIEDIRNFHSGKLAFLRQFT